MRITTVPALLSCLCLIHASGAFAQDASQASSNRDRTPQPEVRYPLGPDSLPQDGVPKGKLEGPFLHHSKIIEDTVRKYWIYVPAQYQESEPAALLVFHDGARAINPNGVIRAPQVLENLIAKKQIPVTIGLFITPGQRGDEYPDSIGTGNPDNRDREYDVLTDDFARMLIEEIIPDVEKTYNLTDDPRERVIGGSSSGAICAFTAAWERPDYFQNVVSFIGSFTNIHGGHVYPQLIEEAEPKPIRIFLQDGVNDLRNPGDLRRDWHIQNQKMVAAFESKGYDMAHVFGIGGHSDDHGGAMLPLMLRWMWRDHEDVSPPTDDLVAQASAIEPDVKEPFPGFDPDTKTDPSGVYAWTDRFGGATTNSSIELRLDGDKLTGSFRSQRGEAPAQESSLIAPEMKGNKIVFDVERSFGERTFITTFQGIVGESGIQGWRMMDFGGRTRDIQWAASREKP